jgi:hypothetical protein
MVNLLGRTGGSRRCFSFERKMMDVGTELAHLWGTADYDCLRTTNYCRRIASYHFCSSTSASTSKARKKGPMNHFAIASITYEELNI